MLKPYWKMKNKKKGGSKTETNKLINREEEPQNKQVGAFLCIINEMWRTSSGTNWI